MTIENSVSNDFILSTFAFSINVFVAAYPANSFFTRPPIHALHSINPERCYEEERNVF